MSFETPDDLASGPTVRGPSRDVVEGRLVVPHADDDGAIEGRIGLSVPASIEAVPAGGDPRRSLVTPDILRRWHRQLIARTYDGRGRRGPGRPRVMDTIRRLIVRRATERHS